LRFFKVLPPCLIGMEVCATAHYWARELTKLGQGCGWCGEEREGQSSATRTMPPRRSARQFDARAGVIALATQLEAMRTLIGSIEKRIKAQHRSNEVSQLVETIPGI
jgi:transposase